MVVHLIFTLMLCPDVSCEGHSPMQGDRAESISLSKLLNCLLRQRTNDKLKSERSKSSKYLSR
jgi:hypothetical protein